MFATHVTGLIMLFLSAAHSVCNNFMTINSTGGNYFDGSLIYCLIAGWGLYRDLCLSHSFPATYGGEGINIWLQHTTELVEPEICNVKNGDCCQRWKKITGLRVIKCSTIVISCSGLLNYSDYKMIFQRRHCCKIEWYKFWYLLIDHIG